LLADGARVRACAAKAALKRERKENDKEREREGKDTGDDDDDDEEEDAKGAFKKCARAPLSLCLPPAASRTGARALQGREFYASLRAGSHCCRAVVRAAGRRGVMELGVCACGADRPRSWASGTSSRSRRSLSK
jgi:hypothetical protein